jgi:uncharacterized protein
MSLFAITSAEIEATGRSIEADLPVDWLDKQLAEFDLKATEPGHLSVRLSRTGNDVVVRGKTRALLEAPCGRCLSPTKLEVEGELGLLLQPAPEPPKTDTRAAKGASAKGATAHAQGGGSKGGKRSAKDKDLPEYEFSSVEADADTYDGETVVLDDFVREAILLEVPIFPLCSEDCPGIRPASSDVVDDGAQPRVDPRLAPLGALRAALAQSKAESGESNDDSRAPTRSASASHRKKTK